MHALRLSSLLILVLCLAPQGASAQEGILVNGQPLSAEEITYYGVDLPPGRYWYDAASGLWGAEGGPSVGQVAAGLPLGGPLQADASRSDTGVFINGREIHVDELAELMRMFGEVPPGRYWLGADLIGGVEGQPASFDLRAADAAASDGSGDQSSGTFEDRVTDFCVQNDCPSDLRGAIDDMNGYVPDYGN
ncbi:MAG TPA: hypothetical protein VFV80_12790 [Geminicoccaceae bacterium]|nr:hypothetical protein [Geminicoccaceae bacterium]